MAAFGFAWVDPEDVEFLPAFVREDEDIVSLELVHTEGAFPALTVVLKNPRRPLLDGSPLWAWLSLDGAPAFFGRLIAIPQDLQANTVTLGFVARPKTFEADKQALAASLRVAPYWDPIWIAEDRRDDPDVVLEARPLAWHIDRVTHAVTVSDLTAGEDGLIELSAADVLYDSVRVSYGAPPLRRVRVEAVVSWQQAAAGTLDISRELSRAFQLAGSAQGRLSSFTGQGLEADWPRPNDNLGGGWRIGQVELRRVDGVSVPARFVDVRVSSIQPSSAQPGAFSSALLSESPLARFYLWEFIPTFPLDYEVSRQRIERVSFTVEADVQAVVTEPGEDEAELITVSSRSVSEPLDEGDVPPIGDVRRNSYMRTDRGRRSLDFLIMLARTKLIARARTVQIEVAVPLALGLDLSCRKSVAVNDPRIPGGRAEGKVVEYRLVASGDGTRLCHIRIGCTIGGGDAIEAIVGAAEYVDEDYVASGYQTYAGATYAPGGGGIAYEDYSATPILDDGLDLVDLRPRAVIMRLDVINGETAQRALLAGRFSDIPAAVEALNAIKTEVWLELEPLVGGPFETVYEIAVSEAMIPRTISL